MTTTYESRPYLISDRCPLLLPTVDREEDLILRIPATGARSPGLHVSQIITDLCVEMGIFASHIDDNDTSMNGYMELGSALEFALACRLHLTDPERYYQPGELTEDGIAGTPDIIDLQDERSPTGRPDEIKLAWMSVDHDPASEKFWRYWTQVKAYCKMWGATTGGLRVYHVVGDWKANREPQYRHWGWDFTEEELEDNWAILKRHGRLMVEEGRA